MTIHDDELMGLDEAGRILGRTVQSMRLYVKQNGLPHRKIAGRFVVRRSELAAWAERDDVKAMLEWGDRIIEWRGTGHGGSKSRTPQAAEAS